MEYFRHVKCPPEIGCDLIFNAKHENPAPFQSSQIFRSPRLGSASLSLAPFTY